MMTIYLVELRTVDTEWTPVNAYTSKELAKKAIETAEKLDSEVNNDTQFYYHYIEIKLFN